VTTVTFENATIRDVIGKAAKIAPTKGTAFDKAAGILFEIDHNSNEIIVRSTNTEIFYTEIVDAVSIQLATGQAPPPSGVEKWLLHSVLLDGICSKLPIASGAQTQFVADGPKMILASGRMRANLRFMDPSYYPDWKPFDPAGLTNVSDFGARLQQVQWAASKTGVPPLTGINLDGQLAAATDNYRVAITPCEVPGIYEPVTIPSTILAPLMKALGEVKIGQEDGFLLLMPDDATQIKATIYADKYPKIAAALKRQEPNAIFFKRDHLIDMIDQAMVMGQRDRNPMLKVIIGLEEVAVLMEDQEMGLLGNVMEVAGQAPHERMYVGFTPDNLVSALRAAPNSEVTLYYTDGMPMKPVRLDGGSGYEVLIMPRNLDKKE
jgi:DNA polymerase III sliding clamp (beta) subunit (PCNA family)